MLNDVHEHHGGRIGTAGGVHRADEGAGLVEPDRKRETSALKGNEVQEGRSETRKMLVFRSGTL